MSVIGPLFVCRVCAIFELRSNLVFERFFMRRRFRVGFA
ncbi:hypothetical protein SCH4B_3065 [Ruegeria sp. TrichCH4B]|nr:hypothetical protein SCH4B_3065 [Ruegeria sp. TrichCH4B]